MMRRLACFTLIAATGILGAPTGGPKTFGTPDEAKDAFVEAVSKGSDAVRAVFGPEATGILSTGDPVQDKNLLNEFLSRVKEKVQVEIDETDPDSATLLIGEEEWPFPVPLVRAKGRWYFDVKEGKAEIRRRIIGRNELDAIEVCQGYVDAQYEYAAVDRDGNGFLQYASKLISSEGKKDGLYWPGGDSPVSEAIAKAAAQGYTKTSGSPKPYHGYYYKVLTAQGPDAADGARDYLVQGMMIGGFGLVAWPAEYGVSGFKTFIVNQDGVVYEKDLGTQTSVLVKSITKFNPDKSWTVSPVDEE